MGLGVRGPGNPVRTVFSVVDRGSPAEVRLLLTGGGGPQMDIVPPVTTDLLLDIANDDIVMQLDAIGDSLEVRVWEPGEPMPIDPTISAALPDGVTVSGDPWFSVGSSGSVSGVFRHVWVSDVVVPEPSAATMLVIGLCGFCIRRRVPRLGR